MNLKTIEEYTSYLLVEEFAGLLLFCFGRDSPSLLYLQALHTFSFFFSLPHLVITIFYLPLLFYFFCSLHMHEMRVITVTLVLKVFKDSVNDQERKFDFFHPPPSVPLPLKAFLDPRVRLD